MQQVLFRIPLQSLSESLPNIPIYGYGAMLFLAFVCCTWLAARLCRQRGIAPEHVQDLAVWVFVCGILGARLTYMLQYRQHFKSFWQFFAVWDGGLVFYGSFAGGLVGFLLAYRFVLRRHHIDFWKMSDVIAPCLALGLCLGRVGCLLNGCCYGNVACPDCPAISFPLSSPPRVAMTEKGYQTAAGFTMDETAFDRRTVGQVEPGSKAEAAGLRPGDVIVQVNGRDAQHYGDLVRLFIEEWPRGVNDLALTVQRTTNDGLHQAHVDLVLLPAYSPRTIGLHPTQVYESISMGLLLLVLLAFLPLRRRDGEAIALFMVCYAVHRFLNEMLRVDTDNVAFGMTLSQNISVLIFLAGVFIGLWRLRLPAQYGPPDAPAAPSSTATIQPQAAPAAH